METTYLPGKIRDRIVDLMKERKITQSELATSIGLSESTLSRFLSNKTDKLGDEYIIRIAKAFRVSTDFLLGVTDVPDRKNYEIAELGLSVQAARNLYTGKVHPDVVNRLLESPRFAEVTYLIARYLDDTLAAGYAAQNQMYATLSSLLRGTVPTKAGVQTAQEIARCRTPIYEADLSNIETQFMATVREVKKEVDNNLTAVQAMSKETVEKMFGEYSKGQDMSKPTVTPAQVSELVTSQVAGMDGTDEEALNEFGLALTKFIQSTMDKAAQTEMEHEVVE